ncbi:DUF4376 domain-containing protein [Rhodocyclus purpureus]|uniref:DUF4376 domain-containing protein n=1 Tax=Rhodocyclus purpureus TaxID=1067 RepID=UPI0019133FA4|nr:DUF4376 domain-containing protein [Rhodocyclus purpureus]
MPFYKSPDNALHELDDEAFEHLLPANSVRITEAEAAALQKPTFDEAETAAWAAIKSERDRRTEGGFKVGDKWFHSDQKSRSQQLALVLLGAGIPAGLQWKTMDGSFVTMTAALAQQLLAAAAASEQAIFAAAETHRRAMEASADPAGYDYSSGWPKVFGE